MKEITIQIGGITQTVNEADLAAYIRAGYSVVGEKPAAVEPVQPVAPVEQIQPTENIEPAAVEPKNKKEPKG